jgi:hypothetical protein
MATPQAPLQPTPQTSPVADGGGHPPCPTAGAPPPGHNKGAEPQDRPCTGGRSDHGNQSDDKSKDGKQKHDAGEAVGGVVLVPLGLAGYVAALVRPLERRRMRRWLRGRRRAR